MSKMSDLDIQIQDRLKGGQNPADIAYALDIPISWMFDSQPLETDAEEHSPFSTINS
jgi:hypothetical protein